MNKLYIWEMVFCEWDCGFAVALAPSLDAAKIMIAKQVSEFYTAEYVKFLNAEALRVHQEMVDRKYLEVMAELDKEACRVIDPAVDTWSWYTWGGSG